MTHELAEALTADEAREAVSDFLRAVEALDDTRDVPQFVESIRHALAVTEYAAHNVPNAVVRGREWPALAKVQALQMLDEGKPQMDVAREISKLYGRRCTHTIFKHWRLAA